MVQDRVTRIAITPVAFHDLPLLNTVAVHEPFALRTIVEVETADGLTGLGVTYGDAAHLVRLCAAADALIGTEVFALNDAAARVTRALAADTTTGGHGRAAC